MLYTCGIPYLRNVMFKGEKSANGTPKCADGGGATCPDNDGIFFGAGGSASDACNDDTAGFSGYGANVIDGIYFQNIRTAIQLHEHANVLNFQHIWGDFTDANTMGYFVYIDAPLASAYGNTFQNVGIEQAPYQSSSCGYKGAFGLYRNTNENQISYVASDVGNCTHGTWILDSSSIWNDITHLGAYYMNGSPAVSDVNQAYSNGVYDMPHKTLYRQTYVGGNLGTTSQKFNYLRLAVGIDSPSNITGIPNADKFGGMVGLSNTGVTATYRVYKNGGSTPLHVDITTSGCPGNFPGTSDTVLFNPGDTIELYATQGGLSAPQVSSCTVEHD
jgi:hypothetical protein